MLDQHLHQGRVELAAGSLRGQSERGLDPPEPMGHFDVLRQLGQA